MSRYRHALPQLQGGLFLTDSGLETILIFQEGWELPEFAAFPLLESTAGEAFLEQYFGTYVEMAQRFGTGLILESVTWRASIDWGAKLGYTPAAIAAVNRRAIAFLAEIRAACDTPTTPTVVSGCVGPRGDGYVPDRALSVPAAVAYHQPQIEVFAETEADMVCALTMNSAAEAQGITQAAQRVNMPVAISFVLGTDGHLPTGQSLAEAIAQIDEATGGYPCYYQINCAHPQHFSHRLASDAPWVNRIQGLRANASSKSHAELSAATTLDSGNPQALGQEYAQLRRRLARLNVMGGCCGTDHRHIHHIAQACRPLFAQ